MATSRSGGARQQVAALAEMLRKFRDIGRRGFQKPQYQPDGRSVHFIAVDRDAAPLSVRLNPAAQQWLATGGKRSGRCSGPPDRTDVWLELPAKSSDNCVLVHVRDRLAGTLGASDSQLYLPILRKFSSNPGIVVMTMGVRGQESDGRWRLDVLSSAPGRASARSADPG